MRIKDYEYNGQLEPGDKLKWYRVRVSPALADVQAIDEDHAIDILAEKVEKRHEIELEYEATEIQTVDDSGRQP